MMKRKNQVKGFNITEVIIIIIITSIISALATGIILVNNNRTSTGTTYSTLLKQDEVKDFLNVYAQVMSEYYENVDKKAVIDSAISGMMNYLGDKYTSYLNQTDTNELNNKLAGQYTGIGVSLTDSGIISEVFDDSPAEKAGIQENDKIISINNTDVTNKNTSEISS